MADEMYITIPQLAKLLGVSRIAVYRRVKNGDIPAKMVGRTYVITDKTVAKILGKAVTEEDKVRIADVVSRVVKEYGETLKRLGRE